MNYWYPNNMDYLSAQQKKPDTKKNIWYESIWKKP